MALSPAFLSKTMKNGVGVAIVCAMAASVAYAIYGLVFESFVMPSLPVPAIPYGNRFGFMAAAAAVLGGAIGFSGWLLWNRRWASGILLSVAVSMSMFGLAVFLWSASVADIGRDSSDEVVFVPLYYASAALTLLSQAVGVIVACGWLLRSATKARL